MKNKVAIILSPIVVLTLIYFCGPKLSSEMPEKKAIVVPHVSIDNVEDFVKQVESRFQTKPTLQSQIVWADSTKKVQTAYSVVYLPGFGATWAEAEPVHRDFAKHFGYNLYLHRLYDHGLALPADSVFDDLTPSKIIHSANEALSIGRILGEKVIIMGTSTGCTLGFYLGEQSDLAGFIMFSPNLGIEHRAGTNFLDGHWGLQIARLVIGSNIYRWKPRQQIEDQLWSTGYRIEGLVTLRRLIRLVEDSEVLKRIEVPVFVGYYPFDEIISVKAIERLCPLLPNYTLKAFPDAGHHVIASKITSKSVEKVKTEVIDFWQKVIEN